MALKVFDTLVPQGDYPAVKAEHVRMPDGTRLSEFNPTYPVVDGAALAEPLLEPETYYQFGEVESLAVTLVEKTDGTAHEYVFEFAPAAGFEKPVITPEPIWLGDPQFPVGKKCVVSVRMGLAVTACG